MKKQEKGINDVNEALGIIEDLKASAGLEKIVVRSDIKGVEMNKDNMIELITQHFTPPPAEYSYRCNGIYSKKGKKHTVKLEYFNNVLEEKRSYIPSFASAGLAGWTPTAPSNQSLRRYVVHQLIINFYMK